MSLYPIVNFTHTISKIKFNWIKQSEIHRATYKGHKPKRLTIYIYEEKCFATFFNVCFKFNEKQIKQVNFKS